ncbi:MAG TPA: hypothetical protein VKU02_19505, partial [Gemmataceae bacterium]|nr:hypothetical protein [Gemmataceae bacterium]
LRELARWQRDHQKGPLEVWYFGSDPALAALPMQEIRLHTMILQKPEEFLALVRGHYLAVSTSLLYGSIKSTLRSNPALVATYEQISAVLHASQPAERTTTFLIYDFTEGVPARPRTSRAQEMSFTRVP